MNPAPTFVVIAVIIMCCCNVMNVQCLLWHSRHKESDRTDSVEKLYLETVMISDS